MTDRSQDFTQSWCVFDHQSTEFRQEFRQTIQYMVIMVLCKVQAAPIGFLHGWIHQQIHSTHDGRCAECLTIVDPDFLKLKPALPKSDMPTLQWPALSGASRVTETHILHSNTRTHACSCNHHTRTCLQTLRIFINYKLWFIIDFSSWNWHFGVFMDIRLPKIWDMVGGDFFCIPPWLTSPNHPCPHAGRWWGKRTAWGPLPRTIGRMAGPSLFLVAAC